MAPPSSHPFDGVNLRDHPEVYQIGRGEYGLFHAEPYKSELLPLWAFRTPEIAEESARAIYAKFLEYRAQRDFVGMDLARKYLQMGYTRARRYAKYSGGRKYDENGTPFPVTDLDPEKAEAAQIFHEWWAKVREDATYQHFKKDFQTQKGK